MKRLLLFAAALAVAAAAGAQGLARIAAVAGKAAADRAAEGVRLKAAPARTGGVSRVSVPDGAAAVDYMLGDSELLPTFGSALLRMSRQTLMFDGDKVYLPNMMLASEWGAGYVEGRFNAAGDSIVFAPGQTVMAYESDEGTVEVRFSLMSMLTLTPVNEPLRLAVGSGDDEGEIWADENDVVGLFGYVDGKYDGIYSYASMLSYMEMSKMKDAGAYTYAYDKSDISGNVTEGLSSTVSMMTDDDGEIYVASGMMPDYPDSYLMCVKDGGMFYFPGSSQLISDYNIFSPVELSSLQLLDACYFAADGETGSYVLTGGVGLADVYIDDKGIIWYNTMLTDVSLSPVPTGIRPAAASGEASPASGALYDLSGRRVGKGYKGIAVDRENRRKILMK